MRARRFLESALRLGGASIDPGGIWYIKEGIGVSWLQQDKGEEALSHLQRALETAGHSEIPDWVPGSRQGMLRETLYNLACAQSLMGDAEQACSTLRKHLESLSGGERNEEAEKIWEDPQLKKATRADCYRRIEKEMGLD